MSLINKVLAKTQNIYFNTRLQFHGLLGLPVQIRRERELYRTIFQAFRGRSLRIFEWGSGYSTIYYAKWLKQQGFTFQWEAVDNHKKWVERVQGMVLKSNLEKQVQIHLKEFPPFWEKPGWDWKVVPPQRDQFSPQLPAEKDYVNFPAVFKEKFDIIFIDARFRRRCLAVAFDLVKDGGVVVIHDAQKPQYRNGTEKFSLNHFYSTGSWYPLQQKPNQVWIGSKTNKDIFETLKSFEEIIHG